MTELRKIWIYDENGYAAQVDQVGNALVTLTYNHHEIHSKDAFTAEIHTAAGTAVNIAFKTPSGTKRAHMICSFASESKAHLTITEGATWTTNTGTVLAPTNQFRESSPSASVLLEDKTATPAFTADGVLTNVTGISGGSVIREIYSFTSKQTGGSSSTRDEIVLQVDQTYVIALTSDDGSKGLQLRLEWYEHTDSN